MSLYDSFTGIYPVSKTLRFELKPIGETQSWIEKKGYLSIDEHRAESYKKVKKIIDRYHQQFIDLVLENMELIGIEEYEHLYNIKNRDDKQEKQFDNIKSNLRKQISDAFKSFPQFKDLFSKDMIEKVLIEYTFDNPDEQKLVSEFKSFSTYFQGFYENRKNMYSCEGKSTEVAYRIIDQNLPKFLDNIKIIDIAYNVGLKDELNHILIQIKNNYRDYYSIDSIDQMFNINGFNSVLSQKGINLYNYIIGGFSEEERKKIQGVNEIINIYNQHLEKKETKKIPKCKPLFKQILSDRDDNIKFLQDQFESDEEVIQAINDFCDEMKVSIFENAEFVNIQDLFSNFNDYNLDNIFIKNGSAITDISQQLFSDWSIINQALEYNYDKSSNAKNKNNEIYFDKRKKALKKNKAYSIGFINNILSEYKDDDIHIENYYSDNVNNDFIEKINNQFSICQNTLNKPNAKSLQKNDEAVQNVKILLDLYKELQRIIQPLINYEESSKDPMFYSELERIWSCLDILTPLYNKVRNYVTKKPYSLEKYKLNFNRSTLLSGWDKNKEEANLSVILIKDNNYYLGIMDRDNNQVLSNLDESNSSNVYRKMNYKLLPGPNKMLPKVFFSKSRIDEFNPSEEILDIYNSKRHIKSNEDYNIDDCHKLIDFFKESISKHEEWSNFGFEYTETELYKDISGFYREVEKQGYRITYSNIDASYIDQLVSEGKLYLFQIYNKDFSEHSKGTPNLHTLYWKMIFDERNLNNVVYKLNGEAEVFYRKASINENEIIRHSANIPINNKNPLNPKEISEFDYEIIKDKRYTIDKYQFHVPITMNFGAQGDNHFNLSVNKAIKNADNVNVIGIDRGERNLLYLVVINSEGKILEQQSLNEIVTINKNNDKHCTDYHLLLDKREKDNISARQNWKTINTIKELKEGYLSQVIHIIAEWMIKYDAIVVLEDLNFGFKRGRQKFEKQVYQKFEKMLIDKLNYLVDKNEEVDKPAGLLKALQLTNKFETFKSLGKQSGFLYYVPAWLTSKIDPTTGFANLFNSKDLRYNSVEESKKFIGKFKSIIYNSSGINGKDYFEFTFDYNDFSSRAEDTKSVWTICTYSERINHYRNPEKNNEWDTEIIDLTSTLKKLFDNNNINYNNGDFKDTILQNNDKTFYKELLWLLSLTLQMRNSDSDNNIDRLVSPVLNDKHEFFDTDLNKSEYPKDADANGAYNIARKGLWVISKIKQCEDNKLDKLKLAMSNKEWLQYAQDNRL